MKLYSSNEHYKLYQGNMLDMLEVIETNSIDSIITDPPYELNFMNKGWDNTGIAFQKETWQKCYEVLKPGGYLLAFGGSRTFHRIACAIEDAGFEIRDTIMWLYGSGFPKSMSLSKGLEAREKLGNAGTRNKRKIEQSCDTESYTLKQTNNGAMGEMIETTRKQYIPDTDLAKQWSGWGSSLKPSYESIIVARKPFKGSLVDNVLKYGVGGLNINECRVGDETISIHNAPQGTFAGGDYNRGSDTSSYRENVGRFPANTILTYDESDYDEVCGGFPNGGRNGSITKKYKINNRVYGDYGYCNTWDAYQDSGSASRYFYCAKASKKDRDEGLDIFIEEKVNDGRKTPIDNPFQRGETLRHNSHPTVKPCTLMQYLVRLVTPNGGTILDPFNGSGSTGKAVMYENKERNKNYKYIGIELTEEYLPISKARIEYLIDVKEEPKEDISVGQISIFDLEDNNE